MIRWGLCVIAVMALCPIASEAQATTPTSTGVFLGYAGAADTASTPGFHKLIFQWSEGGQHGQIPFSVYLPHGYGADSKRWPMLTFMGGLGDRGSDPSIAMCVGVPLEIGRSPELRLWMPMIVLTPQCPADQVWDSPGMSQVVLRLVRAASERFNVDPTRQYVTGFSDGGKGSWVMACEAPELFAVTAPVVSREYFAEQTAQRLAGSGITCLVISGLNDPKSEPASARMVEALQKRNVDVVYAPLPGGQHFIWQAYYSQQEFYQFLLAHQRGKPTPANRFTGRQFTELYQARERSNQDELVFDHRLQHELDRFEPYWFVDNCARSRSAGLRSGLAGRGSAFVTVPLSVDVPCRLQTTRQLTGDADTSLAIEVGHPAGTEWELVIRVNEQEQERAKVNDKTAPNGWLRLVVSLKPWRGNEARLQLIHTSAGKTSPAYWSEIKLTQK